MSRSRPADSGRRARSVSDRKIDIPVLIISTLTVFFATLFATLLLMRPESADPVESMRGSPVPGLALPPVELPPVDAAPPELDSRFEPGSDPILSPALRNQLEQLGIKCADGANCYAD